MHIVLYQPQIAENTGNIVRLAANTGAQLHLIRPYGFIWDNRARKRATLDYGDTPSIMHHDTFTAFHARYKNACCYLVTTRAKQRYDQMAYGADDMLFFGAETHGVSDHVRQTLTKHIRIPMQAGSRSLNLANSVALVLYEALRQKGFIDLE